MISWIFAMALMYSFRDWSVWGMVNKDTWHTTIVFGVFVSQACLLLGLAVGFFTKDVTTKVILGRLIQPNYPHQGLFASLVLESCATGLDIIAAESLFSLSPATRDILVNSSHVLQLLSRVVLVGGFVLSVAWLMWRQPGRAMPGGRTASSVLWRVYHPYPAWRVLLLIGAGFFVLLGVIIPVATIRDAIQSTGTISIGTLGQGVLGIVVPLLLASVFVYVANRPRLVVSPTGIEYDGLFYRIRSAWNDVERIGSGPYQHRPIEGLVLCRQESGTHPEQDRSLKVLGLDRFIPLTQFAVTWRDSPLGHDIRRYAPHLFAEEQHG